MQADDIIVRKDWADLSLADKETIKELAETEADFVLLKKMLQVARESNDDIPEVSAQIPERLLNKIRSQHARKPRLYIPAIAASLLVALALFFLLKNDEQKPSNKIVKNEIPPSATKTAGLPDTVLLKQDLRKDSTHLLANRISKPKKLIRKEKINNDKNAAEPANQHYRAIINTAVANDSSLLAFVTEIF